MFSALFMTHRAADIVPGVGLWHKLAEYPSISTGDRARADEKGGSGSSTNPPLQSGHLDQ